MRSCCCNAASGLASPEAEAARRVRGDVTTAPNVGAGLAGRDEDPVPPPPPPPPLPAPAPLAEANRPAASEVHDAGVAGRDDDDEGEGEDGACTCTWESSCTARLSAATSCSRSSRLRANRLCARATVASPVPSTNARTARSTSCASASLVIAPGTASSVAYPRAMRSSSAIRISSSTRASWLKSSRRARIVCKAEIGREEKDDEDGERAWSVWLRSRSAKWQSRNAR